ncbi:MAG TPA: sigma-70 family RNA polymerase sigma factor [Polyangiaceae bacterium]|nr:sigma-70 family RNA polymerase sigma factor [Polyangiaceae bacterium]
MHHDSASERPRKLQQRGRVARRPTEVDVDEEAIRAAARAGDGERAATLALRALGEPIRRYLQRRLAHRSDAEEAFSDFSETLWLSLRHFRGDCSVRTWAFVIARSVASRHSQRRGSAARRGSDSAALLGALEDLAARWPSSRMSPEDLLLASERRERRVRSLHARLRPRDAAALRLLVEQGCDVSATALCLNTSCNNVYQIHHRILRVASAL